MNTESRNGYWKHVAIFLAGGLISGSGVSIIGSAWGSGDQLVTKTYLDKVVAEDQAKENVTIGELRGHLVALDGYMKNEIQHIQDRLDRHETSFDVRLTKFEARLEGLLDDARN